MYDQSIVVCHDCDAVVRKLPLAEGEKLVCPRCGGQLCRRKANILNRGLALSLSALIMAIPASTLPLMTFKMLGLQSADTLVKNVYYLFDHGFWWIAILVMFCSMLAPIVESLLVVVICLLAKARVFGQPLILALKGQSYIRRWAMLEVYMLGILVAYVKMIDSGDIYFGIGMLCFMAMLLFTTLNTLMFDARTVWEMVGRNREQSI